MQVRQETIGQPLRGGIGYQSPAPYYSVSAQPGCCRYCGKQRRMGHIRNLGRAARSIPIFFVLGATLPQSEGRSSGDFCARLATNSGIDKPASPDGRTSWTVNALNFGQRFLFGGSAATGVGVRPIDPATVEDYKRLEGMCVPEGKGAVCRLAGPASFSFTWKGTQVVTPVEAGERAKVTVIGTRTTCESESAMIAQPQ